MSKTEYPGAPKLLRKQQEEEELKNELLDAEQMSIQHFLLARQKHRQIMVPFDFKVGDKTFHKEVPCRVLTREEQDQLMVLKNDLLKLSSRLNNPPKTKKALEKLKEKSIGTLDELYRFAASLCLDPELTFEFMRDNNITLDVPLSLINGSASALRLYSLNLPKFRR